MADALPSKADQAILKELNQRYTYATHHTQDIRDEADTDMRYVGGNPWSDKDRTAREDAGRVCLSLDELHQYFNQLINDVRANPRAPQFDPAGNGATDKTAQFYGDKMREIEYRSQAAIAYTTAFQNAVHRSYGWMRFRTKYAPKAFDQDLWIEEIPNPNLVLCDPDALRPSSSDAKYLFYLQGYSRQEFAREFPDAEIRDFTPQLQARAPNWISADCERVQVAEYWMVEPTVKTLTQYRLPTGQVQAFYDDELDKIPSKSIRIDEREDEVPTVCMYVTNGLELLKKPGQKAAKVAWAGKYIPFVSCLGMVIYVDSGSGPKRQILSLTRLARDPYMLYCYYRTCEAEVVGMTPKIPYFVRRGSLKADQLELLQKSLHEPVAVIQIEGIVDGVQGMPDFPVRNPYTPQIQELEAGAEAARRAIQAAMGISPLPTPIQRQNQKSGAALHRIESSEQKGSFHFVDHYESMLQHAGVIVEDLMEKVYDTARTVGVRDAMDQGRTVRINDPTATGPNDVPSITGDHTVTIEAGPSFASQRQEGADFLDSVVANLQQVAAVAGPTAAAAMLGMSIKLKNLGEIGDEMYKIVTPPQFQQQDGQPPDPKQLMAQLQGAQQKIQQLEQAIASKMPEIQAKAQTAQMQEQHEDQRTSLEQQTAINKAEIAANAVIAAAEVKSKNADLDRRLKLIELFLTAQQENRLDAESKVHEAVQTHRAQLHEAHLQGQSQAHEAGMAALQQAHGLASAQQAADLAPPEPAQPAAAVDAQEP